MAAPTVTPELLNSLTSSSPQQAWDDIAAYMWETFSAPLPESGRVDSEIISRDRGIAELENVLAGSCWDLWSHFEECVPKGSQTVIDFWNRIMAGKAVLILDGLSLREAPWILAGAQSRGYTIHDQKLCASELPCETTPYAKALGFQQRSQLSNNMASSTHSLTGAHTESNDLPWADSAGCVGSQENFAYWHHWPDHRIHDLAGPGKGLGKLAPEAKEHLTSDEFWELVERMAGGRRLVITSDHGYAACGYFADLSKDQGSYMKDAFGSKRAAASSSDGTSEPAAWVPPIDLELETTHGKHRFVLGRRKWKVSGQANRLLAHGGLSLLEVFVPYVELSK